MQQVSLHKSIASLSYIHYHTNEKAWREGTLTLTITSTERERMNQISIGSMGKKLVPARNHRVIWPIRSGEDGAAARKNGGNEGETDGGRAGRRQKIIPIEGW
jgi:hypothetical protein